MNRRLYPMIPVLLAALALAALSLALRPAASRAAPAQSVSIVGPYEGDNAAIFAHVLADFYNTTGITVTYVFTPYVTGYLWDCSASSTCPDLAIVNQPGLLDDFASRGVIHPLDSILTAFDANYSPTWRRLSSAGSKLYSVPFQGGTKSLVWYRPETFNAISATPAVTWTAWISLSESLLAAGVSPFSIGIESNVASGWPLSDWLESFLIGVGGVELTQNLVQHKIAWTDPQVVQAMQYLAEILSNEAYQAGGSAGTINTFFGDAIDLLYTPPYTAGMNMGGWFMEVFMPSGLNPGVDYATFPFPMIDPVHGHPVLAAADQAIMLSDTAESRALIQYLGTAQAAEAWLSQGAMLSPNLNVEPALYPNDLYRAWAAQITTSESLAFDLDDQLPPEVQHLIWQKMVEFAADTAQLPAILQAIEIRATQYQGSPYEVFLPALTRAP